MDILSRAPHKVLKRWEDLMDKVIWKVQIAMIRMINKHFTSNSSSIKISILSNSSTISSNSSSRSSSRSNSNNNKK